MVTIINVRYQAVVNSTDYTRCSGKSNELEDDGKVITGCRFSKS